MLTKGHAWSRLVRLCLEKNLKDSKWNISCYTPIFLSKATKACVTPQFSIVEVVQYTYDWLIETSLLITSKWKTTANCSNVCLFSYALNRVGYENYNFLFVVFINWVKTFNVCYLIHFFKHVFQFQKPVHHLKIWPQRICILGQMHSLSIELLGLSH